MTSFMLSRRGGLACFSVREDVADDQWRRQDFILGGQINNLLLIPPSPPLGGATADDPSYHYNEKMEELCREKKWKLLHKSYEQYRAKDNLKAWLYIYQVLEVAE